MTSLPEKISLLIVVFVCLTVSFIYLGNQGSSLLIINKPGKLFFYQSSIGVE